MVKVIQNASTDYKRKLKPTYNEILTDFTSLSEELLSDDDSSFFVEKCINYSNIEEYFSNKKYSMAVKNLSDKEISFNVYDNPASAAPGTEVTKNY